MEITQNVAVVLIGLLLFGTSALHLAGAQAANSAVAIPPATNILARLDPAHPRLLATPEGFVQLKKRMASDSQLQTWHASLRTQAQEIMTAPPSRYEIPDGLRLLATSRRVMSRVYTLGLLYRLDREQRYAERAWQELAAAASFPDWNPRHFLDTAEMTHAFAIGYDWLYDVWTPQQRSTLRRAIVEKGLNPALKLYRTRSSWTRMHHNWNQVCNGGMVMGALAIADEAPDLAGEIVSAALKSLPLAMASFAPDGGWNEGPGYWSYTLMYTVPLIAALGAKKRLSSIPLAAGLLLILMTATITMSAYRKVLWEGETWTEATQSLDEEAWETGAERPPWVDLLRRVHSFDSLVLIAEYVPREIPFDERNPFVRPFFDMVPRLFYPDKPDQSRAEEFSVKIWRYGISRDFAPSKIAPSMAGDLYWSGGVGYLILGGALWGLLIGAYEGWKDQLPPLPARVLQSFLFQFFLLSVERDFAFVVSSMLQGTIALLFVTAVLTRGPWLRGQNQIGRVDVRNLRLQRPR